jgi:hypothetical protein
VVTIDESRTPASGGQPGSAGLAHLSAHYYQVTFDQDAHRITIDATGIDPADAVDLDALVLIGDPGNNDWRYKRLELETEWCADRPDEDVRDMYLIVSNHDMFVDATGQIEIEARNEPCGNVDGSLAYRSVSETRASGAVPTNTDSITSLDLSVNFDPSPEDPSVFRSTAGSWQYQYSFDMTQDRTQGGEGCIYSERAGVSDSGEFDEANFVEFSYDPETLIGTGSIIVATDESFDVLHSCPGTMADWVTSGFAPPVLHLFQTTGERLGDQILFRVDERIVTGAETDHTTVTTTLSGTLTFTVAAP